MKKATNILILVSLTALIVTVSCKKEDTSEIDVPPTTNEYYIKSTVNGSLVIATYSTPNSSLVSNAYFTDDNRFQFERKVSSGSSQGWNVHIEDLDLDNITYPRTLKETNLSVDPYIDVSYNNGTSGAAGNFVINNLDSNLFSLTLNKWSNDVLEGTFSGELIWGSSYDSTFTFSNGEFKIKLVRF